MLCEQAVITNSSKKNTYLPETAGLSKITIGVILLYHAQITILVHQTLKGRLICITEFK